MSETLLRLVSRHPALDLDDELETLAEEQEAKVIHGPLRAMALYRNPEPERAFIRPPVVFTAHRDQIALRISHYDEDGFGYFVSVGGWDPQILLGQRMLFMTPTRYLVVGVVGRKAIHLIKDDEAKGAVKLEDMWVDFGFKTEAEGLELLPIGSLGVVDTMPTHLANGRLSSRALDDLAGVAAIIDAMKRITEGRPVVGVFTQHEETIFLGASGNWVADFDPAAIIAVDVTFAEDPSTSAKDNGNLRMGKGPVVSIGGLLDPKLTHAIITVAASSGLPFQVSAVGGHTSTDADGMALAGRGHDVVLIGLPIRYMHSPIEVVDLTDYENLVKLLVAIHHLVSTIM